MFEEKAAEINAKYPQVQDEEQLSDLSDQADSDTQTVFSHATESTNPDIYVGTEIDMTRSGQLKMGKALFVKQTEGD